MILSPVLFGILLVISFFGFSSFAVVYWLKTPKHDVLVLSWHMKWVYYYGIGFSMLVVATVLLGMVLYFALKLLGVSSLV